MDRSWVTVISGVVLATLTGRELLKAYRTDSTPFARSLTTRVSRLQHPRVFWFAVAFMSVSFLFGVGIAGWALISPTSFR